VGRGELRNNLKQDLELNASSTKNLPKGMVKKCLETEAFLRSFN